MSPERRAYVAENFPRSKVTPDWQELIADPEIHGVIVATPAHTHYEIAAAALKAGKHVLVEKPLASSTEEVDRLTALAREAGATLMVGHTFLYNAAVRKLKSVIDAGDLGDVMYLYCQRLNLGIVRSDVNAWWNLAPHDVAIALHLLGDRPPEAVRAFGVAHLQPGIEDVVFADLLWSDKVHTHIHVSWLDPGKVRKVTVVGSRKMVVYDDVADDKLAIYDKGIDFVGPNGKRMDYDDPTGMRAINRQGDLLYPRIQMKEPLAEEAAHFVDCIRSGREPVTGAAHARAVVAVLEAVDRSLRSGGTLVPLA